MVEGRVLVVPGAPFGLGVTRRHRALTVVFELPGQTGYGDASLALDGLQVP